MAPVNTVPAQELDGFADNFASDGQMLIEADTLVYDNDRNTVTAVGNVRIDYNGNRLVAESVTYDRTTSRLIASGNVEIVDPDGTRITSDQIDITDDFRDGFVQALRVETADKVYFAADNAERSGGTRTVFNRGIYTACEPCEERPDKAPIWRIKGKKIIWNGETKTVRFESARFEFFGLPIAYFPFFEIADPTVKRKSGFLLPDIGFGSDLGFSFGIPYYFALSPTFDLTVKGTYFANQGFLGEAEWRQRFNNGEYSVRVAGISQNDPDAFRPSYVDSTVRQRGMIGTKGAFQINPRWMFGWDVLVQSDKDFASVYGINGYQTSSESKVFLTGLDDRNYFDLRASKYFFQERFISSPRFARFTRNDQQPWVLPSFDYTKVLDEPVLGGELRFDLNAQGIYRDTPGPDPNNPPRGVTTVDRYPAAEGTSGRLTGEAEWRRSVIAPGGLVLTPLLHARADGIFTDLSAESQMAIGALGPTDLRSTYYRTMATAGLEARWPILFATENTSHVIEPMAQVFLRPNEPYAGTLGIPNEDSQSFVFDATTLFERDKFAGYDRIEGGSRVNAGFRYSGDFGNDWAANAIVGQSYHIGGVNSFTTPDLVNAGAFSGLETDVSDYVALVGLTGPDNFAFSAGGRFDERSFELRRSDVRVGTELGPVNLTSRYTFIQAQPLYGFATDRHEVFGGASVKVARYWKVFGSALYDIGSATFTRQSIGFGYDDECFNIALSLSRSESLTTGRRTTDIGFRISLRTLGEIGSNTAAYATP